MTFDRRTTKDVGPGEPALSPSRALCRRVRSSASVRRAFSCSVRLTIILGLLAWVANPLDLSGLTAFAEPGMQQVTVTPYSWFAVTMTPTSVGQGPYSPSFSGTPTPTPYGVQPQYPGGP